MPVCAHATESGPGKRRRDGKANGGPDGVLSVLSVCAVCGVLSVCVCA